MVKWYYKRTEREVPHRRAPRRGCFDYSKVYCDVRKRWFMTWNQSIHITYYIFIILIPKSVFVFFTFVPHFVLWHWLNHCAALVRNLPTSILVRASVCLLTFHTHASTILALLWFTNFESCRFQNLSVSTLSCLVDSSCMTWSKMSSNIEGSQQQFQKRDIFKY